MSIAACAEIVARGDEERFLAAMAAPVAARAVLFPLYAFAVEVARAPWATQEPMIAEMRLQWWRDALEEIAEARPVRRHEVTTPLSETIGAEAARRLDAAVAVRRWDIYRDAFEDAAQFDAYLDGTAGTVLWTAAEALGAPAGAKDDLRAYARAVGLARFLRAVPALEERGRVPLVDGRAAAIADLAKAGLDGMARGARWRRRLGARAGAALLEGWQAGPVLRQAARDPGRVGAGALGISPARGRLRLLALSSAPVW